MKTNQMNTWSGEFGKRYTDRNNITLEEMDKSYIDKFGISRTKINEEFLSDIDKNIKILEVGTNVGNQLLCLQSMGFKNLYGIELQEHAIEIAKKQTENIYIIKGDCFDIPFKDKFFDLVYTSGVLIHISPKNIEQCLKEIVRCSNKFIWGFEYFAENYQEVNYRGNDELLWKTNFSKLYTDTFSNLTLVKEVKYKYLDSENIDVVYLLQKNT